MRSVRVTLSSLRSRIAKEASARGSHAALLHEKRYDGVLAAVRTIVNTALARLEAEGKLPPGFPGRLTAAPVQGFVERSAIVEPKPTGSTVADPTGAVSQRNRRQRRTLTDVFQPTKFDGLLRAGREQTEQISGRGVVR